ncbi:MAG: hypothetical protein KAU60_14325, partial [Desulfobacterales bacterium]|nr:hypothetical protein [Desulfobacterales bacterium]
FHPSTMGSTYGAGRASGAPRCGIFDRCRLRQTRLPCKPARLPSLYVIVSHHRVGRARRPGARAGRLKNER